MPGAWTTITVKDGGGTSRTMRAWDESGAGTGPYSFASTIADLTGAGSVVIKAASTAAAAGDESLVTTESPNSTLSATTGVSSGAAVVSDANGTLQQYLRGLVKMYAAAIASAAGAVFSKITDGTNTAAVKAASTAPAATDPALVVAMSPNAWDTGTGTGGSKTQRVVMDSSQLAALATTAQTRSAGFQLTDAPTDGTIATALAPRSTGNGATESRVNAAASANATSLKASAGQIYEIDVFNVAAYTVFLKFYNKASAPTVGTDTPIWTVPVPAGGGYSKSFRFGKTFSTGVAYAITKLQADSDTTVVAAGDLTGSIDWI